MLTVDIYAQVGIMVVAVGAEAEVDVVLFGIHCKVVSRLASLFDLVPVFGYGTFTRFYLDGLQSCFATFQDLP